MASSGWSTLTGTGRLALAASTYIKEVQYWISVQGNIQVIPAGAVSRIMHAGLWALGYHNQGIDTTTHDVYYHFEYFDCLYRDTVFPASLVFADSLFYSVQNGATVRMDVFW